MSDLPWCRSKLLSIDHFDLFHICQRCKAVIEPRQEECCKSNKFQLNFKLRMTVSWDKGQFEVIAKSKDVVRILFHAQSDEEWNLWLDGFKRMRKFFFYKSGNYNPAYDIMTPEQVRKLKQLLSTYLHAFSKPTINYNYEMKLRKLSKSFPHKDYEDRYYCVVARRINNEI